MTENHINESEERLLLQLRKPKNLNYEDILQTLLNNKLRLTSWEQNFIDSLDCFSKLSQKQRNVLYTIYIKYFKQPDKRKLKSKSGNKKLKNLMKKIKEKNDNK